MRIRPIKSDEDLDRALARVEELWDAQPGTPEDEELDVLLVLIEDYEKKHHKIPPGDPIEVVLYKLEELELTHDEFARRLGWTRETVVSVLDRRLRLTLAMVRSLA